MGIAVCVAEECGEAIEYTHSLTTQERTLSVGTE